MRKESLASLVGAYPFLQHLVLDAPHRLHLRNAGVGDAVHVPIQQLSLVRRSQIAVVRHALIEVMRHQIENIFLRLAPVQQIP